MTCLGLFYLQFTYSLATREPKQYHLSFMQFEDNIFNNSLFLQLEKRRGNSRNSVQGGGRTQLAQNSEEK